MFQAIVVIYGQVTHTQGCVCGRKGYIHSFIHYGTGEWMLAIGVAI